MKYLLPIVFAVLLLSLAMGQSSSSTQNLLSTPTAICGQIFPSNPSQSYAGKIATIANYNSFVSISILIILMVFTVLSIVYAIGYSFQFQSLTTFAKTEFLENGINLIILAAVGGTMALAWPGLNFFAGIAGLSSTSAVVQPSTLAFFTQICNNINTNVINSGFSNWFGVFSALFFTNALASGSPPSGGFGVYLMPNLLGVAFLPFQGLSVLQQLLWDEQSAYFGSMMLGMFLIVLLFIIYYLFPLFFYVGIALRSFPWTRAAGGSFIALFIAFYIIFPAILFPFTSIQGTVLCNQSNTKATSLCNSETLINQEANPSAFLHDLESMLFSDYGSIYYQNIYAFAVGLEATGVNLFGFIISLLISYEAVEKLGGILGAPSLQGSRALSRIL